MQKDPLSPGTVSHRESLLRRMNCEPSDMRAGDSLHSSNYSSNPLEDAFHKQNSHAPCVFTYLWVFYLTNYEKADPFSRKHDLIPSKQSYLIIYTIFWKYSTNFSSQPSL